jgi:hypothetical protein
MAVTRPLAQRVAVILPGNDGEVPRNSTQELKAYYAALLVVLLMVLAPIWIVKYPGMVDYPNHLVRCYILAHYHDNPLWQQRYLLDLSPLPNLAIDLIVTPLLRILPLIVAGKVFLSLAAALYVLGCSEVGRTVIGKLNWLALVCAFTFYNSDLLFGFVNYVFGIGVFLCAFAYWLRIRNAMTPLRFFLCCLLSLAAYFAHLSSVVILGIACCTIALLEFVRDRKIRSLIVKLAWLACPVFLMAGFLKSSGQIGTIDWGSPSEKLIALLAPVRSYSVALDVGVIFVLLVCALAMLRGSKVHSVAVVSPVLFALLLITPKALYTVSAANARYVIPAYLLLILSIEPCWGRWRKAALAVALAAMAIRTRSITADWLAISQRSEQLLAMGNILPEGARIYVIKPALDLSAKRDRGDVHVIQFWTVSHDAELSNLFAFRGAQPLVFRQPPCGGPEWEKCLASYDFVWTYDPPEFLRQVILRIATPAAAWEKVTLWRVNRKSFSSTEPGHDTAHFCRGKYIDAAKQMKKGIRGGTARKAMNLWSVPEEDGSG